MLVEEEGADAGLSRGLGLGSGEAQSTVEDCRGGATDVGSTLFTAVEGDVRLQALQRGDDLERRWRRPRRARCRAAARSG